MIVQFVVVINYYVILTASRSFSISNSDSYSYKYHHQMFNKVEFLVL
jgi:hypothetical protein